MLDHGGSRRSDRESLAIERAIKDDPAAYQAWRSRQLVLERAAINDADDDEIEAAGRPAAVAAAN